MLILIVFLPLLAALALAAVPGRYRFAMRLVTLAVTLTTAVLATVVFWRYNAFIPGFQFESVVPGLGVESLGIHCRLGVDGINVGLILLAGIVGFAAACVSWEIQEREKEYYILLLTMTGGILGAFASLDLFFFYFFHELALVPTFLMIGIWGRGSDRAYATYQITLYLGLGALLALVGLTALYVQSGAGTFDLQELGAQVARDPMSAASQTFIFPWLMFGFGILVSLWPFHTWAPLGYASAPTATAMLHAGVLKKFGLYGLIRVALPMLPDGARLWLDWLVVLALGNILYCGLVALRQRDLNLLVGNSSVAHMGFAFLGLASFTLIGITGALVVMVAHGLLAALTFALSGYLRSQTRTLEIPRLGGLLQQMPFIGGVLVMALLAGCGLPGFANFIGETLVFFGSWSAYRGATVLAVGGGLILGAVYMLRAIRDILHGPALEEWAGVRDAADPWRRLPFVLLLTALIVFGMFPRLLTDRIEPSVRAMLRQVVSLNAGTIPAAVGPPLAASAVEAPR